MNSWLEKHKPNDLKDLYLFDNYIKKIDEWFLKIKNNKVVLNIQGPVGSGKTILAQLYLKKKDYNINYFCINNIKSKSLFIEKIKETSKTYDILNLLKFKKQKNAYIIDEVDNNNLSKNELNDIIKCLIINKNPLILIGTYNKNVHYPKKHLIELKINRPNNILLEKILNNILNREKIKLDILNKNKLIKKSQNDIRKLIIISEYLFSKYLNLNINIDNIDVDNIDNLIYNKDIDYDLYKIYNQLMNNYITLKDTNIYSENLLNNLVYNNIYNQIYFNTKTNNQIDKIDTLYDISKNINSIQCFETYYNEYQFEFIEYSSVYYCNYISHKFNNLKKASYNKFTDIEYPRNIYINNQNNLYKKLKFNFENIEKYSYLTNKNINDFLFSYINYNKNNFKNVNIKNETLRFIIKYLNIPSLSKEQFLELIN